MFKSKKVYYNLLKFNLKNNFLSSYAVAAKEKTSFSSFLRWPRNWLRVKSFVYFRQVKLARLAFLFGSKSSIVQNYQSSLLVSVHFRLLSVYFVVDSESGKISGKDKFLVKDVCGKLALVRQLRNLKFFRPTGIRWLIFSKLKRIEISLSLLTIRDRIVQVFLKLLLEPITEVYADPNSYGFRLYRSSHQLVAAIHSVLLSRRDDISNLSIWSFNVSGFFTKISQNWLLLNLPLPTYLVPLILSWIRAGSLNTKLVGGILLPIIINFMLNGYELRLLNCLYNKHFNLTRLSFWIFRYGTKILILGNKKQFLKNWIVRKTVSFLSWRGLCIRATTGLNKVEVNTLIEKNLIFLGYEWSYKALKLTSQSKLCSSFKSYQKEIVLFPNQNQLKLLRKKIRNIFHYQLHNSATNIIAQANTLILGWCKYYCFSNLQESRRDFEHYLFKLCWNWVTRKHVRWGKHALAQYYFLQKTYRFFGRFWVFRSFSSFHENGNLKERPTFLYLPTIISRSIPVYFFKLPLKVLQIHAFHKKFKNYLVTACSTVDYLDY